MIDTGDADVAAQLGNIEIKHFAVADNVFNIDSAFSLSSFLRLFIHHLFAEG